MKNLKVYCFYFNFKLFEQYDKLYISILDNLFCEPLAEGWYWDGQNLKFSVEKERQDMVSQVSDQARTPIELVKAMSSLVDYLVRSLECS